MYWITVRGHKSGLDLPFWRGRASKNRQINRRADNEAEFTSFVVLSLFACIRTGVIGILIVAGLGGDRGAWIGIPSFHITLVLANIPPPTATDHVISIDRRQKQRQRQSP